MTSEVPYNRTCGLRGGRRCLFNHGVGRRLEHALETVTEQAEHHDQNDGDEPKDESVLDGTGTFFVFEEIEELLQHFHLLSRPDGRFNWPEHHQRSPGIRQSISRTQMVPFVLHRKIPTLNQFPLRSFVIGDIQGCLEPLMSLLERIGYAPEQDRLILLGDLVNRGPQSLGVLRFVRSLGDRAIVLLGNHDLHLLATAHQGQQRPQDSLEAVLSAPDAPDLLRWLRHQRMAWQCPQTGVLCVHAGLPREWDHAQALGYAHEVESALRSEHYGELLDGLYGNQPDRWDENLVGLPRLRFIINALTRQRMQYADGRLEFRHKGPSSSAPAGLVPWFLAEGRRSRGQPIAFGHWSTLGTIQWPREQVWGLDSGCVWGGALSALELQSKTLTQLPCTPQCAPGSD